MKLGDIQPGVLFWEKNERWGLFFLEVRNFDDWIFTKYLHTYTNIVITLNWSQKDVDYFIRNHEFEIIIPDP